MPHDAKGKPIKVGDEVTMRFEVMNVSPGEKDCNVMLVAIDVAGSGQAHLTAVSCNSKLTEKAG